MKPLYLLLGLGAAAAAGIVLYEKNANAATSSSGASGAAPLSLPAATNATVNTNPTVPTIAPVPNPGAAQIPDFLPATLAAAANLDGELLTSGCTTQSDPTCQQFQNAYQADPKGGALFGGADGLYGTSTQTALSQVLGTPAPASCFSN